jgi:hypothetical protein
LIKQVLEYLDGVGLHGDAIESYYAISKTVRRIASRNYPVDCGGGSDLPALKS